ncbi:DHS-like NAD/FAD-binding domain-containing protein [Aureobasidium pullulans]|uniref:DHS-like NAD/FAD-binding domain-containing protein n=1 Tax=Aureobasidium pullulans TaxID=5580 RepID=A0A4S8TVR9_AURPU|nr:DHS-like NAD/FAD-binding domain-containing protein [Aureobasidium pullulans]THV88225.1 DHS-like NAD/FAD-binding domain-containing protein [Aureobasidium pullulans]THX13280.1 DHS-like NAD/FAD-binding domain-containing protein [Aureobasidium pullulans]
MDGYDSDGSSLLSSPKSPTPPPEMQKNPYPSPPRSKHSSQSASPSPDDQMDPSDNPRPAKRRRISEKPERTTEYLDLSKGLRPDEKTQLDRILNVLHKRQKIVVVAGAGISVSAGIPDFRSSTGLFNSLRAQHNLKGSGKDLFDASHVYKDASSTASFHQMVREMSHMTKSASPTPFHQMLATLAQQDRLLRLYSQNVDGIDTSLEPLATRIPLQKEEGKWPKTIQLHGGLDKMVCSKCHELSDFHADLFDGPVPPVCGNCEELNRVRTEVAGKRSHGVGMLRPRMVLYNEHNPDDEAIGAVTREDLRKRPDAIIVVGTTLKVPGVKRIVREMCATVRDRRDGVAIWINAGPEPSGKEFEDCWDIVVKGTCDEIAKHAALRQWDEPDTGLPVSEETLERARQNQPQIPIVRTFKAPPKDYTPMPSPQAPASTPLTGRRHGKIVDNSFTEEEDLVDIETPSRRAEKKPSAFNLLGKPTTNIKIKAPSKASVTKATTKRSAAKKAPPKPQGRIDQTLKKTKTAAAAAAIKAEKNAKGGAAFDDIAAKDVRLNSPRARSSDRLVKI